MSEVLVIAPHPDDETLGCGGTLLAHSAKGDHVHWLIFTAIDSASGYTEERIKQRRDEIQKVQSYYGFTSVIEYGYQPCTLDTVPMSEMVARLSEDINKLKIDTLYIPHVGDIHSDHKAVNEVALSSSKWFRHTSVKTIRVYETLSETGMPGGEAFIPNQYSDISSFIDKKIDAMKIYDGEMGEFPFPRSEKAIRALATYRGAYSGYESAEAFQLLFGKDI